MYSNRITQNKTLEIEFSCFIILQKYGIQHLTYRAQADFLAFFGSCGANF
jgi:hypothetical protein